MLIAAKDYTSVAGVNVSADDQLIVGFEVSINGRFWVSTEVLVLVSAYLRYAPVWFSKYAEIVDAETEDSRKVGLAGLMDWRRGHLAKFPHAARWHAASDLLMGRD